MRCEEVRDQLADYLRGELRESARAEWSRHVESCRDCREEMSAVEGVWRRLGDIPAESLPAKAMRARFEQLGVNIAVYGLTH